MSALKAEYSNEQIACCGKKACPGTIDIGELCVTEEFYLLGLNTNIKRRVDCISKYTIKRGVLPCTDSLSVDDAKLVRRKFGFEVVESEQDTASEVEKTSGNRAVLLAVTSASNQEASSVNNPAPGPSEKVHEGAPDFENLTWGRFSQKRA